VAALAIAAATIFAVVWRRGPAEPSTGTTAFPYLQLQPLTFTGDIQSPAISPDGRFVAFIRQGALWVRQVSAASADQDVLLAPRVEARSYESPTITPNGESVDFIVTQGNSRELWRVPLLGGTPRPIQTDAGSPVGWSPDGTTMAFVRNVGEVSTIVTADASGGNRHVLVEGRAPLLRSVRPAWSPDGREILAIGGSSSPTLEEPLVNELLFFEAATGRLLRRIPITQREVRQARWLDRDRLIVQTGAGHLTRLWATTLRAEGWTPLTREFASLSDFDSTADQNAAVVTRLERRTGIWSSDARGGTPRVLVAESGAGPGFPVLDDSGGMLYSALLNDGTFGVYRVGSNDSRSVLVASGILTPETWAATHDGRVVVFTGDEGPYPLRRVNVDGSGLTTLVPSNGAAPAVTPDARTVVFSPFGPGILRVPLAGGPVQKVSDRSLCCPPVISPDGRRLIVSAVGAVPITCELPDCARPTELRVAMTPSQHVPYRWAPDGRGVAFVPASDPANIWVQPLDGGAPRRVTESSDTPIMDFSWSPDGTRLAMSRGTYHSDLVLLKGLLRDASR
jgi:Tol biopolymer transport system component